MDLKEEFESTEKLWRLTEIALQELKSCKKQGIGIDMEYWVLFEGKKACSVCLAGAVMVNQYRLTGYDSLLNIVVSDFRLSVLDKIRNCDFWEALCAFRGGMKLETPDTDGEEKIFIRDLERKAVRYNQENQITFLSNVVKLLKKHNL